jgi:hypothetical protein
MQLRSFASDRYRKILYGHGEPVEPWTLHPSILLRMSGFQSIVPGRIQNRLKLSSWFDRLIMTLIFSKIKTADIFLGGRL